MRNNKQKILAGTLLLLSICSFCYLNLETNQLLLAEMSTNTIMNIEGEDASEIKIIKLIITHVSDLVCLY